MRFASAVVILAACASDPGGVPIDAPGGGGGTSGSGGAAGSGSSPIDAPADALANGFNCGRRPCTDGETCTTEGEPWCGVQAIQLCTCVGTTWQCHVAFDCTCPDAAPASGVVCGDGTLLCSYPGPTCCSCIGGYPDRWDCEPGACSVDAGAD